MHRLLCSIVASVFAATVILAQEMATPATGPGDQRSPFAPTASFSPTRFEGMADPTGALTQRIDVRVPPFHGLEPRLALAYHSRISDGPLGVGWSLAGVSAIQTASPGKGIASFDGSSDSFLLDGELLHPCVAGSPSPSCRFPTTAGAFNYFFTDIERYERIGRNAATGNWSVWLQNGNRLDYTEQLLTGRGDVARWLLTTVTDTSGNQVAYGYGSAAPGAERLLTDINYSKTQIIFHYARRTYLLSHGIGGGTVVSDDRRLVSVEEQTNGSRVRAYALDYNESSTTGRSLLSAVQEFGTDVVLDAGGIVDKGASPSSLPPTTLTYKSDPDGPKAVTLHSDVFPAAGGHTVGFAQDRGEARLTLRSESLDRNGVRHLTIDLNGDGIPDHVIMTFDPNAAGGDGAGAFPATFQAYIARPGAFKPLPPFTVGIVNPASPFLQLQVVDVSGDHRAEIVVLEWHEKPVPHFETVTLFFDASAQVFTHSVPDKSLAGISTDLRLASTLETRDGPFPHPIAWGAQIFVADVNGDGYADLLLANREGADRHYTFYIALGRGDGSFRPPLPPWPTNQQASVGARWLLTDLNGDGRADLAFIGPDADDGDPNVPSAAPGSHVVVCGALARTAFEAAFEIAPFAVKCQTTAIPAVETETSCGALFQLARDNFVVADVNGDGSRDIVRIGADLDVPNCHAVPFPRDVTYQSYQHILSDGDGTFTAGAELTPRLAKGTFVLVADLEGDGRDDLLAMRPLIEGASCDPGVPPGADCAVQATVIQIRYQGLAASVDVQPSGTTAPPGLIFPLGGFAFGGAGPIVNTLDTLEVGDFDGDGHPEIAVWHRAYDRSHFLDDFGWLDAGRKMICGGPVCPFWDVLFHVRTWEPGSAPVDAAKWKIADVDGDGYPDYVKAEVNGTRLTLFVRLRQPDGSFRPLPPSTFSVPFNFSPDALQVADVNGDGLADLVEARYDEPVAAGRLPRLWIVTLLAAGGGTFTSSTWPLEVPRRMPETSHWLTADTNGDGKADLVYITTVPSSDQTCRRQAQLEVFRWSESFESDQNGNRHRVSVWTQEPSATVPACQAGTNSPDWYVYDVDRNGTQDFVGVWPTATSTPIPYSIVTILSGKDGTFRSVNAGFTSIFAYAPSRWTPIDLNGDGLPELAAAATDIGDAVTRISADVLLSSGDGNVTIKHALAGSALPNALARNVAFMEWNGDGRTDLVRLWWEPATNGLSVLPLVSDGSNFVSAPVERIPNSLAFPDVRHLHAFITDGSHRDSFEYLASDFHAPRVPVRTSSRYAPPRLVADLLNRIDEPLGVHTSVDYSQMTRAAQTSDPPNGCRLPPAPGYLVSKVTIDPGGDTVSESIDYACPRYSPEERTLWAWQNIARNEAVIAGRPSRTNIERWDTDDHCGARLRSARVSSGGSSREITFTGRVPALVAPYQCETQEVAVVDTDAGGSLSRGESFTYGEFGGIDEYRELGDTTRTGDERTTHVTYEIAADPFIVTVATSDVHAGVGTAGPILLHDEFCYDGVLCSHRATDRGLLTAARRFHDVAGALVTLYGFDYDTHANLTGVTDANNNATTISYETTLGLFPERVRDSLGHETQLEWDLVLGQSTAIVDPNRIRQNVRKYDPLGRLKSIETADKGLTTFDYRSWGMPSQSVRTSIADGSPSGLWSEILFDGLGRTTRLRMKDTEAGAAYVLSFAYGDLSENPKEISHGALEGAPGIPVDTLSYDYLERLASIKHPDGTTRTATIQALGGSDVDEAGHRRDFTVDAYDNVTSVSETGRQTLAFEYDLLGHRTMIRDAANDAVTYGWDSLNRVVREDDPDLGVRRFTYDLVGNLTGIHDPRGNDITLTYDAVGRPATRLVNGTTVVTWKYDQPGHSNPIGRLTSMLDSHSGCTVARSFDFDVIGRITSETRCWDGTSYTLGRQFDPLGRLVRFTYPSAANKAPADGEVVTASFEPNGRPATLSAVVAGSVHDPEGRIKSRTLGNGVVESYAYDPLREWPRVSSFTSAAAGTTTFTYRINADGTMAGVSAVAPARSVDTGYTIDDQHRLTQATTVANGVTTSETFAYDGIGNLAIAGTDGYGYPPPGPGTALIHAPKTIGPRTFVYDAAGNTLKVANAGTDEQRFEWDEQSRMKAAEVWDGTAFRRTEVAYDAYGRRIKLRTPDGKVLYDFFDEVEQDDAGRLVKHYFCGDDFVAWRDGAGKLTFVHRDILGSIRLATDDRGSAVDAFEYGPFGLIGLGKVASAAGRGFTGQRHDLSTALPAVAGSGLISLGTRSYDPFTRRFLSPDAIISTLLASEGLSRYAYALNNPTQFTDPTGNEPENVISPGPVPDFGDQQRFNDLPPGLAAIRTNPRNYPVFFLPTPPKQAIQVGIATVVAAPVVVVGVVYGGPYIAAAASSLGTGAYAFVTTAARTGALSLLIRFPRLFGVATAIGAGVVGQPTAARLTQLSNAGGPTIRVVTNLTRAPESGRALSTAAGEAAEALANAALSGSSARTFVANIPKALIDGLEQAGLVRVTTTLMNGNVQATEYRFFGAATEYILKFFTEVKPPGQ